MFKLSDNYYNRKFYLETDQGPTFGVIERSMRCPLAKILLKTLLPYQKIVAGLEPPLQGGGGNWYMPPEDLLKGRAVLKPGENDHLAKLGYKGIENIGDQLLHKRANELIIFKRNAIKVSDRIGQENLIQFYEQVWNETSKEQSEKVSEELNQAYHEFIGLYTSSLNNLEDILLDAAYKQVKELKEQIHADNMKKFDYLLKEQACRLNKKYDDLLENTKQLLKDEFIKMEEVARYDLCKKYHDINVEKHTAIEKLRNLLENRNLACQVYIALKERDECQKEVQRSKKVHLKQIKALKENIAMQDFEISLEMEKKKQRIEFKKIWKTKVCQIVKKFQKFVQYCLMDLPKHADFFINLETMMLLQLGEAAEEPNVQNTFDIEKESHIWPTARPYPYRLFCDKGHQQKVDSNLCPKHCTSSASQFPVIVINNKCMYAACDDFTQFTNKVKQYVDGRRGEDADFEDDHVQAYDIHVNQSPSKQIFELQLESSLMQVLQKERANMRELPLVCETCKSTYCFCSPLHPSTTTVAQEKTMICTCTTSSSTSETKLSRYVELDHKREPQIASYLDFIKTKKCSCATTAKKHLREHLPPYMIRTSEFEQFEFPLYERCSVETMKKLVWEAKQRGRKTKPNQTTKKPQGDDKSTQCEDAEYAKLCQCVSEDELNKLFKALHYAYKGVQKQNAKVVDGALTPSYLTESKTSFATKRARSLRQMMDDSEIFDVFEIKDCKYN